ncbi:MAG TPA: hypothetical protein VL240_01830 [Candidatus Binatia bacterium]|nr:hypothetical protein [Candidatus Binatia bacterium]
MSDTTVTLCHHTKASGARCGSPALRGMRYCFYHYGARQCLPVPRGMFVEPSPKLPDAPPMHDFPIPFLDDPAALQIGYMQALYGITSKRLELKQARLVLTALDGALRNLKQMEAFLGACAKGKAKAGAKKPAAQQSRVGKRAARV